MAEPRAEPAMAQDVPPVTQEEIFRAVCRLKGAPKAPGPDGVPGKVLHIALKHLGGRLSALFDECLAVGRFPRCWKEGRLVLLRKEGRPADSPSGHRPLVMLDETGKLLERVIASRINQHLADVGPNLSEGQFGFRVGRSTLDALSALKGFTAEAAERGQGVMAVSLDIANAFGSLPFEVIGEALRYHGVPLYLQRIVEHYLTDRVVLYMGRGGSRMARPVTCGVPQGSVLGPLLWNIGYDWVIRGAVLPRMAIICFADDTLVAVRDTTYEEVARRAEVGASMVVDRIGALGLRVSLSKTEALCFRGPRWRLPRGACLRINGETVEVKAHIKYLGLTLDGSWKFEEHFRQMAPRLVGAAGALSRLLPNVGGPDAPCRRLFAGVIRSMALYGAPIWAGALTARTKSLLRKPQRVMAVRMCRAYRTVGWAAACALAGTPPWEIEAEMLAEAYRVRCERRDHGEVSLAPQELVRDRELGKERVMERWVDELADAEYGIRTIEAIRPVLLEWCKRSHGALTFRLVQVLSGHGCFGRYLHRVAGREMTPSCHECGAGEDTAQHTLEVCPAWSDRRRNLAAEIGGDLSLPSVINAMLGSESSWEAVSSFCEEVISQKEEREREPGDNGDAEAVGPLPIAERKSVPLRDCHVHLIRQKSPNTSNQEPELRANTSSDVSFASQGTGGRESSGKSKLENIPEGAERVKQKRKRFRPASSVLSSSDEESTGLSAEGQKPQTRGRGRPPTTGKYAGLAKAKEAYNRALREELRLKAELEVQDMQIKTRQGYQRGISGRNDPEGTSANKDLGQQVTDSVAIINKVAVTSKNLSGGYIKCLKDAAAAIADAFSELSKRTATDETARLQADNNRLQAEVASLRKELADLKRDFEGMRKQGSPQPPPTGHVETELPPAQPPSTRIEESRGAGNPTAMDMDTLCQAVMAQVGSYLDAHLAGIQDRLLPERAVQQAAEDAASGHASAGPRRKNGRKKKIKKAEGDKQPPPLPPPLPPPRPPPPPEKPDKWTRVEKKGRRKKSKNQKKKEVDTPKGKRKKGANKLRPPRSAAVVMTLLEPKATESGADFGSVLADAKRKVRLEDLGISGLRLRKAQTGAYIMEIPGTTSGDKADALAKKLVEVTDPTVVRVSRPIKCAELRISGLDESVLSTDVVTAVAHVGGCAEAEIRPGEIIYGRSGLGTVWLRCPVPAAKKVVEAGRLLVGWVSAQVKLLDARPLRCFRCLEVGHVKAKCKAAVDRSLLCYRCGCPGHVASACAAAPHCVLCAEAGLAANHKVGSKACNPQKSKKGKTDKGPQSASQPNTQKGSTSEPRAEEEGMVTE
ncbi:uncharacterized protein [Choristoneura fumiferana]|uniref:uncharacterized protein n=1 Tax=Choristoneura fumiferana TaxID=7141 RepID=UPI003D15F233